MKVAASLDPQARILEVIKPELKKEGIELEIIELDDYTLANRLLHEKQIDANFFQHLPYLEKEIELFGYDIVWVAKTHIEPLGIYSFKIASLSDLKQGAIVALPSDTSNQARALRLLEKADLIRLKNLPDQFLTLREIIENPKHLSFKEIDASLLPRLLPDVDIALIPGNYVLQSNLPLSFQLLREEASNDYVNVLVIRKEDLNKEELKSLIKSIYSSNVKKFLEDEYKNIIIPLF